MTRLKAGDKAPLFSAQTFDGKTVTLKDLAGKPIAAISRQMVLDRHRRISEKHGLVTANTATFHYNTIIVQVFG